MHSSTIFSSINFLSKPSVNGVGFALKALVASVTGRKRPQPAFLTPSVAALKPHYLEQALERGEFSLDYQPQIELKTGQLLGAEVLIRWHQPQLGTISPTEFIPLAESTDLIVPLNYWVLEQACGQYQRWASIGIAPPKLAVNLSACQFDDPQLPEKIKAILDTTQMPPSCLVLEVTESDLVNNLKTAIASLGQLQSLGVQIAIDDFGTGYSSLFCLNDLPVNYLKLDKFFIKDVMKTKRSRILLQGMIELAHRLKLEIIAQGVECIEQFNLLQNLNCDSVQGLFISLPLNLEAITNFLYLNNFKISKSRLDQEELLTATTN